MFSIVVELQPCFVSVRFYGVFVQSAEILCRSVSGPRSTSRIFLRVGSEPLQDPAKARIIMYSITLALRAVTPKTCSLFRELPDTNRTFVTPTMTGSGRRKPPSKEIELAVLAHETLYRAKRWPCV